MYVINNIPPANVPNEVRRAIQAGNTSIELHQEDGATTWTLVAR